MHTFFQHTQQCIHLRLSLQGLLPTLTVQTSNSPIKTETLQIYDTPSDSPSNRPMVHLQSQSQLQEEIDERCCVPTHLHGADPEKKLSATQTSFVIKYGTFNIRVCQLDHWKDEKLRPFIMNAITNEPSTQPTASEKVKCCYSICGPRRSGPVDCSKILSINSCKYLSADDALGHFCSVDHAIKWAAEQSKGKVSTLLKDGKAKVKADPFASSLFNPNKSVLCQEMTGFFQYQIFDLVPKISGLELSSQLSQDEEILLLLLWFRQAISETFLSWIFDISQSTTNRIKWKIVGGFLLWFYNYMHYRYYRTRNG